MPSLGQLETSWVPNRGAACTTAAILAGLAALGARELPPLGPATLALGAAAEYGAPALLDYVGWPGRRPPLDRRVEALASRHGLRARCDSRLAVPGRPIRPGGGAVLVANLAWGQEAPGRWGTWGWHPLRPATYAVGGHSVVVAEARSGWLVLDPNWPGFQHWSRPGVPITVTRISPAL